jgi:hypothetical protein
MAKQIPLSQLIESHRPKYFKHKYIINDENLRILEQDGYDLSQHDTIKNDEITKLAIEADYKEYDRTIVGKAKEPTPLDD